MFLRVVSCLLGLMLAVMPAAFAENTFTMAGFDGEGSNHDWNTNQFFVRMQEKTGVSFTFAQYNSLKEWQAAKDAMFADGGDMPDVLFKAALTTPEMIRLSDSGKLIDLKPLLAQNAPNLWALLESHPDWLRAVTLPSGKIAALPTLSELSPQNVLWINQAWLDTLRLDKPTDMQSLRAVLTAFRDRDPNQNGKQDEIPLTFLGPWELKFFAHAYGVVANDYNIYLDEAGQVQFWPQEDSFFELAQELRGLYRDKLLDQSGFMTADALRRLNDDKAPVTYGAFFAPTPGSLVTYDMSRDYVAVEPFVYEGKQVYRDLFGQVTRGTFAITAACEQPETLLRWVDQLYTPEGAILAMVGKENEEYVVDADGLWDWKGGISNLTAATLSEMSVYDTGDMPWLFPQAFYDSYIEENVRRVNQELKAFSQYVKAPFPTYTLTPEESRQVAALQLELGAYVDKTFAQLVLGQLEITDETKADFQNGLAQRGVEQMKAFWQGVADRSER